MAELLILKHFFKDVFGIFPCRATGPLVWLLKVLFLKTSCSMCLLGQLKSGEKNNHALAPCTSTSVSNREEVPKCLARCTHTAASERTGLYLLYKKI